MLVICIQIFNNKILEESSSEVETLRTV